jgi:cobalt/nickel transport system permease protein
MHVADGVLSPEVCVAAGAVSAAAVGYSLHRLRDQIDTRTVPLTGMVAALIFAGQMVNFPLLALPVSGHLMGGVLAAVLLGPWAGLLAISLVLVVQCLLFADGGLLSLGVNILHMGVAGCWGGYALVSLISGRFSHRRTGLLVGTVIASWLTVVAASMLFSLEFWLSRRGTAFEFSNIFTLMVLFHSLIGIGEAAISAGILRQILAVRPDLLPGADNLALQSSTGSLGRVVVSGAVVSLAIAAFLAPFASGFPDGLEAVAEKTEFLDLAKPTDLALLDDYAVPAPVLSWEQAGWWELVSVSIAGVGGVGSILLLTWLFTRNSARLTDSGATA